jgi:hypothetical protein
MLPVEHRGEYGVARGFSHPRRAPPDRQRRTNN